MSNSVKSKFAGLLRGLWRRGENRDKSAPAARQSVPAATSTPTPAPGLMSAGTPLAPAAGTMPATIVSRAPVADEISLPVAPIVSHLPMELRAKLMTVPSAGLTLNLPMEMIVSQLAFGAVKISFGELRQLCPGLFANSGSEHDIKMISLPLSEILHRLNPSLLARHTRQKVEVEDDIKGPFNTNGRGVTFTTQPLKSSAAPSAPLPKSEPAPTPEPNSKTEFFHAPLRMNTPAPSAPLAPPSTPLPFTSLSSVAPTVPNRPSLPPMPPRPANGNTNGSGHHLPPPVNPPVTPVPKKSAAPAPVPPAPAPVAPRPEPAQPTIYASLSDLAEAWPEELKNEILASSLANISVPLAGDLVEAGLKRGRVTMNWKQLRALAKPNSTPSPNDLLELDLPLKVIAPLFFAAQKNISSAAKKTTVSAEIPNLFFGFPQAAPEAPVSAPKPVEKNPVVEKKANDSNFYVWGQDAEMPKKVESVVGNMNAFVPTPVPQTDFSSRQLAPKDLVARAITLPGVAGVVVALPDGLRVASQVPVELNAETIAAFVPQIFERMNQSTKELRMGALNNVNFTVGNVPWRIYRVNAVYVAAFGRAGEALPAAQLAALAGELDRKK